KTSGARRFQISLVGSINAVCDCSPCTHSRPPLVQRRGEGRGDAGRREEGGDSNAGVSPRTDPTAPAGHTTRKTSINWTAMISLARSVQDLLEPSICKTISLSDREL